MPHRTNRTLLRATAELVNAANAVRPLGRRGYGTIPAFAFGWPTSELAPLYLSGSALDALRRGLRGDFNSGKGRIALAMHAIGWALLVLVARRNVASKPYFEQGLRDALGADYREVAATSDPTKVARRRAGVFATGWSRRR